MRILLVGDSQAAGPPGQSAEQKLRSLGHETLRVGNPGMGPYDYSRLPELWNQYLSAVGSFRPDAILLVFGSNDPASTNLRNGLQRMKDGVRPPVYLSGPPRYADVTAQARGAAIREVYKQVFPASRYIDAYLWTGPEAPRAPDGLHFTREGGAHWGVPLADEFARRVSTAPLPSGRSETDRDGDLARGGRGRDDDTTRRVALPGKKPSKPGS